MNHREIVDLIREGVSGADQNVWADVGAGWGNFTRALRDLIGDEATIYAIDRDANAFQALRENHGERGSLITMTADFTQPLELPPLDGMVIANALHFVRNQQTVLQQLRGYLKPGGRLVLVEYDFKNPRPWVPFPIASDKFIPLATAAGFHDAKLIVNRRSPSTGAEMYAASASA